MKIDKTKPSHWLCLLLFGLNVLAAMALRPLCHRRRRRHVVILYGHKLAGNLLAIHRYVQAHASDEFELAFLTMDKRYGRALLLDGVNAAIATRPEALRLLIRADAVISDHGLHSMAPMVGHSSLKFFDVWHGFGFKGHSPDDFRLHHRYDEMWVASPLQRKFYVDRFGFHEGQVVATGYARTDRLVATHDDVPDIKRRLGLEIASGHKIILFAPTWKHDAAGRSIYPFGLRADAFRELLANLSRTTRSTIVVRTHLNTDDACHAAHARVRWISSTDFPDAEAMLLISDVLVTDWSSIAFDWLLLDRPTVFVDVPAPFALGHTLDASYRFGEIADSADAMGHALERCVRSPQAYHARYDAHAAQVRRAVFGDCADGHAARRCIERLRHHVDR